MVASTATHKLLKSVACYLPQKEIRITIARIPTVAREKEENSQCRNSKRGSLKAIANNMHANRGESRPVWEFLQSYGF
jgi:ribosomal protein S10